MIRILVSILMLASASAFAQSQSGESRGSIPPGQSQDGSAPSDGAIKGGSILPGESGGMPDDKLGTKGESRCDQLTGSLREECLREEDRAATGATRESPAVDVLTTPPQNPR